jgi:hypothetical protein
MDVQFHWQRDQECQQHFRIYWQPGKLNYADYWTKHHAAPHHQNMRKEFLTPHIILEMLRIEQQNMLLEQHKVNTTMDTWQGCDDLSLLRPDP